MSDQRIRKQQRELMQDPIGTIERWWREGRIGLPPVETIVLGRRECNSKSGHRINLCGTCVFIIARNLKRVRQTCRIQYFANVAAGRIAKDVERRMLEELERNL